MRVNRYRVWFLPKGLNKIDPLWAVAADHGPGKRRTPFIYAKTCADAMDKLRQRHENRERNKAKKRRPPMRRSNPCR